MNVCMKHVMMIVLSLFFVSVSLTASAEVSLGNVDQVVELKKTRLRYDIRTHQSYMNVSVKNIGTEILAAPIIVKIDITDTDSVSVANGDGILDGVPYFEYPVDLAPGETTWVKTWRFDNPTRRRFKHTESVWANGIPNQASSTGRAVLGPLVSSTVSVFNYNQLETPIFTSTTTNSNQIDEAGQFIIPDDLLQDDHLYVIVVSGGSDIDADDDGLIDDIPTPNLGTLHLAATGRHIKAKDYSVNILTELAFQHAAYLIHSRQPVQMILDEMSNRTKKLIKRDIDGNETLDIQDLMAWDPVNGKDQVTKDWAYYQAMASAVHEGKSIAGMLPLENGYIINSFPFDTSDGFYRDSYYHNYQLYIANGMQGKMLEIIDIRDPQNPIQISRTEMPFHIYRLVGIGNYLFALDLTFNGDSKLHVIDVVNPETPVVKASTQKEWSGFKRVAKFGTYVVIITDSGVDFLDVSHPESPVLAGHTEWPLGLLDWGQVKATDESIYVVNTKGIQTIRMDVPSNLKVTARSFAMPPDNLSDFDVHNGYLYTLITTDKTRQLQVFDIENPEGALFPVKTMDFPNARSRMSKLFATRNNLYVYDGKDDQFLQLDITSPGNPKIVSMLDKMPVFDIQDYNEEYLLILSGVNDRHHSSSKNFILLDPERLNFPAIIDTFLTFDHSRALKFEGDKIYLTDYEGLKIIDASNPSNLSFLGGVNGPEEYDHTNDVAINENYAFVCKTNGHGIDIVDISNPSAPSVAATIPGSEAGSCEAIEIQGEFAYVAAFRKGLLIYDISDPLNPFKVVSIKEDLGFAVGISVSNDYAFVSYYHGGMNIYNVENPSKPVLISHVDTPGKKAEGVAYDSGVVYLADGEGGLHVIDVAVPESPLISNTLNFKIFVHDVSIKNNYIYVGSDFGVHILDAVNPVDPVIVGQLEMPGPVYEPVVNGGYVFFPGAYSGLHVIKALD